YGQTGLLTGKLLDDKGAALTYANVSLLRSPDTTFVSGAVTNNEGFFSIPTPAVGKYILRISAIGFIENKTAVFEVSRESFNKDFGNITLKQDEKTLKEVSVTALRPTITQLADRMVVSVEGTAMAAGSTAYAVLAKSPGVFIDQEGNIQLNGRGGVTVMLNGKLTYLSARDLRSLLEGMSAENIKNIEIITNPSSKYDAEGSSGILNINLKKNVRQGMNGSVYTGYTYNGKQSGYTAGGNINYNNGRWNSFLNLDFSHRVGGREATFTRVFYGTNKTTYFDQNATGNFMAEGPPTIRIGTDYTINDKQSIGVMGYFNTNTAKQDFLTETLIGNSPKLPYQFIDADNYSENTYKNFTTNLHYQNKIDTLGTLLSTDLDYVKITNRGASDYYNYFTDLSNNQHSQDFLYTSMPNGYDIYSAKVDFALVVDSLTTGSADRDAHLKGPDFFDSANYPKISFKGTKYESVDDDGSYELYGDLTVKNTTRNIKLDVEFGGVVKDPWGNTKAGFTINGKINRKDFGLVWNVVTEAGGILVGEEVKIACEVQLIEHRDA
ncbi:MAG: hypothetical protein EOO89_17860, partial [Pedobacter sp.]